MAPVTQLHQAGQGPIIQTLFTPPFLSLTVKLGCTQSDLPIRVAIHGASGMWKIGSRGVAVESQGLVPLN